MVHVARRRLEGPVGARAREGPGWIRERRFRHLKVADRECAGVARVRRIRHGDIQERRLLLDCRSAVRDASRANQFPRPRRAQRNGELQARLHASEELGFAPHVPPLRRLRLGDRRVGERKEARVCTGRTPGRGVRRNGLREGGEQHACREDLPPLRRQLHGRPGLLPALWSHPPRVPAQRAGEAHTRLRCRDSARVRGRTVCGRHVASEGRCRHSGRLQGGALAL